jgi:hypothetical protein
MCTEILIKDRGQWIVCLGELSDLLGGPDKIVMHDWAVCPELPWEPELCLCGVDVDACAALLGYRCIMDTDENPCGVVWVGTSDV